MIAVAAFCLCCFVGHAEADGNPAANLPANSIVSHASDPRYLEIVASFEEATRLANPSSASVAQGRAKLQGFSDLASPAQGFILKAYGAGKVSIDPADPKAALKRFQLGANLIGLMQDVGTLEGYLATKHLPDGEKFTFAEDSLQFLVARYPSVTAVLSPDLQTRFRALDEAVSLRIDQNYLEAQSRLTAATDANATLDELNAKMDALLQGIEAAGL